MNNNQSGRSMIEMLGVLAIIGVLSVGGIAGYSKAMEKFKLDKAADEYTHIIFGLLEHLDDIRKLSDDSWAAYGLVDLATGLNLIPATWLHTDNMLDYEINDAYGNLVQLHSRSKRFVVDLFLRGTERTDEGRFSKSFSPKLCVSLFQNLAIPLHSSVNIVNTWQNGKGGIYYRGDAYCGGNTPCVANMTLQEIKNACEICDGKNICCITLEF